MREIETDYLVIGAGASGMAFVDALTAHADVDAVLVDRRHRPGGHWLDAYPFVRLHQPSANYGVDSRPLGLDRIDGTGPNAGFYERATAGEICDYFDRVLADLVAGGRVRFLGMSDYRGVDGDGHTVVSLLTGEPTRIKARKRLVDATYVESEIPSRHTPAYAVDDGVRLVPPNDLVALVEPASGYTVIGAGKTAADTCVWLLDNGVDADRIRWVRPRDAWFFDRAFNQPLELVGAYMQLQARWVSAAAAAESGMDFARRMEEADVFVRLDPTVDPAMFRGAIVSSGEADALRSIEQVVRRGRVRRIGTTGADFDDGTLTADARHVYVDCTAAGVPAPALRPVYGPDRITLQYVTVGIVPWSAATIGVVEALRDDDGTKNRLCPPLSFTGHTSDLLHLALTGMTGLAARAMDPDISAWSEGSRLNPASGAMARVAEPQIADALAVIGAQFGPAMENLARRTAA